jgi:hypothetical protein
MHAAGDYHKLHDTLRGPDLPAVEPANHLEELKNAKTADEIIN